jgi:hypothetical protein
MSRKSRQNLTVAAIDRLRVEPGKSRREVADARVQGLCVRVTSRGVRTLSYIYRSPERAERDFDFTRLGRMRK